MKQTPPGNIKNRKYPYQNTALVNLPDEEWKDIPGFEGYYQISSYGRVKSLSREISMNTPAGGVYRTKELIRKIKVSTTTNKTVNDCLFTLLISLYRDSIKYHFSVARLVYHVFKEPFDLSDRSIYISYKDRDGRNIHVSNLVKTNISSLKLASYEKGRAVSHLRVLSKPVTQFDAEGNPIQTYPSVYAAAKQAGLNASNIAEVASGTAHMYKGFFWERGRHQRKLDLNKIARKVKREILHQSLMKRLGIKNMDVDNPPPFLNLSTETMKGEHWKGVPGYEGLYEVSNLGRVRALQKVTYGKQQKWMPEQIQRISVDFRKDNTGREIPGSTFACMAKGGRKRLVSIPRLVYYLFVEAFEINDTSWRVYYKDGNTLNVTPENLFLKRGVWSILKKR